MSKKKMKKIITALVLLTSLLLVVSPVKAKTDLSNLPAWFQPIQETVENLILRVTNLEESKVNDFEVSDSEMWTATFYSEDNKISIKVFPMWPPDDTLGLSSLPPSLPLVNDNACKWNSAKIGSQVSVRAVAHLPSEDIYGTGHCSGFWFKNISELPPSGTKFSIDTYLWWQGKEKHIKITLTVPPEPFPPFPPDTPLFSSQLNFGSIEQIDGSENMLYDDSSPIFIIFPDDYDSSQTYLNTSP